MFTPNIGGRLLRWYTFGVVFALFPLTSSLLIHHISNKLTYDVIAKSPELLFFSLMLNATALGDLQEFVAKPKNKDLTMQIMKNGLMVGLIFSAILYGSHINATVAGNIDSESASRVFVPSIFLAIMSLALSTVAEYFLGKAEK